MIQQTLPLLRFLAKNPHSWLEVFLSDMVVGVLISHIKRHVNNDTEE